MAKIRLCEDCQWTLLELISRSGETGREIGEEVATAILTIEQDLRMELVHLRLEKGMLAERMRRTFGSAAAFIPGGGRAEGAIETKSE